MVKFVKVGPGNERSLEINDENNFFVSGWSVHHINERYFLRFLVARHGGGEEQFEITEQEYSDVRNNKKDWEYFTKKYGNQGTPVEE